MYFSRVDFSAAQVSIPFGVAALRREELLEEIDVHGLFIHLLAAGLAANVIWWTCLSGLPVREESTRLETAGCCRFWGASRPWMSGLVESCGEIRPKTGALLHWGLFACLSDDQAVVLVSQDCQATVFAGTLLPSCYNRCEACPMTSP